MSRKLYSIKQPQDEEKLGFRKGYLRGYKEGFERGYREGLEKGLEALDNVKNEWQEELNKYSADVRSLTEQLQDERQALEKEYQSEIEAYKEKLESELSDVVSLAAQNYLNNALKEDKTLIKNILEKCLERFSGNYPITVYVNPDLAEEAEKFLKNSEVLSKRLQSVQIVKDNHLDLGAVLDSEEGRVDARVETLAKNLKALVETSLHDNPEDELYKG